MATLNDLVSTGNFSIWNLPALYDAGLQTINYAKQRRASAYELADADVWVYDQGVWYYQGYGNIITDSHRSELWMYYDLATLLLFVLEPEVIDMPLDDRREILQVTEQLREQYYSVPGISEVLDFIQTWKIAELDKVCRDRGEEETSLGKRRRME